MLMVQVNIHLFHRQEASVTIFPPSAVALYKYINFIFLPQAILKDQVCPIEEFLDKNSR